MTESTRAADVLVETMKLPLDAVADAVLRELSPAAGYDDDVAMVIYRHQQAPLRIETDAIADAIGRHPASAGRLAAGPPKSRATLVADIVLVVNEACTNCVEHAYRGHGAGTMLLEVETVDGEIRARITDHGSWKLPAVNPGNSGRGLMLMRAISDSMEIDSTPTGTTVDITFRLPTAPAGVDDWSGGR